MYFLSDEEKRLVLRKLLPEARANDVHPDLRGWNWWQPPLSPVHDAPLGIFEIAGQYCPTGRDVYLRRVAGLKERPNVAMLQGQALHRTVADLFLRARRAIYMGGPAECLGQLEELRHPDLGATDDLGVNSQDLESLREQIGLLGNFEYHRVVSHIEEKLAGHRYLSADSLASLALPFVVELRLDGSLLGLSSHLSLDGCSLFLPLTFDLKFGPKRDFHKLAVTGYALVMEALFESPVDLGCIVYVSFHENRVVLEREIHILGDELRQWFLDARDERARLVAEDIDPGLSDNCRSSDHNPPKGTESCAYWRACHT